MELLTVQMNWCEIWKRWPFSLPLGFSAKSINIYIRHRWRSLVFFVFVCFFNELSKSQSLSRSLRSKRIIWSFDSLHNSCQVCVWSLIEFLFFSFSFLCDTFQILLLFIEVWKFSNFIRNIIQFLGLDNWLLKFPWFWDIYWIQTFEMFLIWKFSRRLKLEIMP